MEDVFVAQLMSSPVLTIEPDATVSSAGQAMMEEGIKSIVVIDDDCHPEGILTSTDFVQIAADERRPTETTVSEYMTTDILTTTAGAPIRDVAQLMGNHSVSHVPVVGEDDEVTGIITSTDLTMYVSGIADLEAEA